MAAFVCRPTFPSLGVGLILYQCRAETSADASHSSLCQLEMALEWGKKKSWPLRGRTDTGWVSLPCVPSSDH